MVDLYYLLPEHRKGITGVKLFKNAEADLKELGVKKIYTGCKLHLDHTKLFEFLGYTKSDYQFIKLI
jgi:N-acetylglutamate synthase-like GNAT family acetyltransferase